MAKPTYHRFQCPTHTTYQAKRAPRSNCSDCLALYTRGRIISSALRKAADEIAAMLPGQNVSVRADFDGYKIGVGSAWTTAVMVQVQPK